MTKKYDVCARLQIEGRDKPLWPKIGMTITVKDDGKISLYDARTGTSYYAFEREQRQAPSSDAPQSKSSPNQPYDDEIPGW